MQVPLFFRLSTSFLEVFILFLWGLIICYLFVNSKGAGHNDVELYSQYLDRLKQFVSVELANWQVTVAADGNSDSTNSSTSTEGCLCLKPERATKRKNELNPTEKLM